MSEGVDEIVDESASKEGEGLMAETMDGDTVASALKDVEVEVQQPGGSPLKKSTEMKQPTLVEMEVDQPKMFYDQVYFPKNRRPSHVPEWNIPLNSSGQPDRPALMPTTVRTLKRDFFSSMDARYGILTRKELEEKRIIRPTIDNLDPKKLKMQSAKVPPKPDPEMVALDIFPERRPRTRRLTTQSLITLYKVAGDDIHQFRTSLLHLLGEEWRNERGLLSDYEGIREKMDALCTKEEELKEIGSVSALNYFHNKDAPLNTIGYYRLPPEILNHTLCPKPAPRREVNAIEDEISILLQNFPEGYHDCVRASFFDWRIARRRRERKAALMEATKSLEPTILEPDYFPAPRSSSHSAVISADHPPTVSSPPEAITLSLTPPTPCSTPIPSSTPPLSPQEKVKESIPTSIKVVRGSGTVTVVRPHCRPREAAVDEKKEEEVKKTQLETAVAEWAKSIREEKEATGRKSPIKGIYKNGSPSMSLFKKESQLKRWNKIKERMELKRFLESSSRPSNDADGCNVLTRVPAVKVEQKTKVTAHPADKKIVQKRPAVQEPEKPPSPKKKRRRDLYPEWVPRNRTEARVVDTKDKGPADLDRLIKKAHTWARKCVKDMPQFKTCPCQDCRYGKGGVFKNAKSREERETIQNEWLEKLRAFRKEKDEIECEKRGKETIIDDIDDEDEEDVESMPDLDAVDLSDIEEPTEKVNEIMRDSFTRFLGNTANMIGLETTFYPVMRDTDERILALTKQNDQLLKAHEEQQEIIDQLRIENARTFQHLNKFHAKFVSLTYERNKMRSKAYQAVKGGQSSVSRAEIAETKLAASLKKNAECRARVDKMREDMEQAVLDRDDALEKCQEMVKTRSKGGAYTNEAAKCIVELKKADVSNSKIGEVIVSVAKLCNRRVSDLPHHSIITRLWNEYKVANGIPFEPPHNLTKEQRANWAPPPGGIAKEVKATPKKTPKPAPKVKVEKEKKPPFDPTYGVKRRGRPQKSASQPQRVRPPPQKQHEATEKQDSRMDEDEDVYVIDDEEHQYEREDYDEDAQAAYGISEEDDLMMSPPKQQRSDSSLYSAQHGFNSPQHRNYGRPANYGMTSGGYDRYPASYARPSTSSGHSSGRYMY